MPLNDKPKLPAWLAYHHSGVRAAEIIAEMSRIGLLEDRDLVKAWLAWHLPLQIKEGMDALIAHAEITLAEREAANAACQCNGTPD